MELYSLFFQKYHSETHGSLHQPSKSSGFITETKNDGQEKTWNTTELDPLFLVGILATKQIGNNLPIGLFLSYIIKNNSMHFAATISVWIPMKFLGKVCSTKGTKNLMTTVLQLDQVWNVPFHSQWYHPSLIQIVTMIKTKHPVPEN